MCCARSHWLANLAAVRNEPFRAISVHVNLTPPTITKTCRSNYAHIIKAKYFYQRFCQLPFHLTRLFSWSGEYFIPVRETFQTYVSDNHSVKILECPEYFPLCFLSLFLNNSHWEFQHGFRCYPLNTFLSKQVCDKGSLKADACFCQGVIATSIASLIYYAVLLTFWQKDVEHYYILQPCF